MYITCGMIRTIGGISIHKMLPRNMAQNLSVSTVKQFLVDVQILVWVNGCQWGVEQSVMRLQTRERGPPLAPGKILRFCIVFNHLAQHFLWKKGGTLDNVFTSHDLMPSF